MPSKRLLSERRLLRRGRDRHRLLRVEDDDVGVGADRDRPLARVEAEELRRARRQQLDHAVERDAPVADAELVDHLQPVLDPAAAVRDLREVVAPAFLLLRPTRRAVVGGDRLKHVRADGVPEHVLVLLRARRRRVDVLRCPRSTRARGTSSRRRSTGCRSRPRRPSRLLPRALRSARRDSRHETWTT